MKMTTEQEESEAEKAAESDAAAMQKLLGEIPAPPDEEQAPPPEKEEQPPPADKPPPPPAEPPPPPADVKPKDTPADQDDFEKEIESDKYELPEGSTRQAREVNKLLKQQATAEHRAHREAATIKETLARENDELKAKITAAAKDQEDLGRIRPILETIAIERDPHFNDNFARRVSEIEMPLMERIVSWGLPPETADYIMKAGGPARFSKDSVGTCPGTDANGNAVTMSHKEFWEKSIVGQLNRDRQDSIRRAFDDVHRVADARDAALRHALSNRQQYFKGLEEESKKKQETFKANVTKELEAQRKELGELAAEREIPKDASEEQRKAIEVHNTRVKDASQKFEKFFFDTSEPALVRKALGGLLLEHMKGLLAEEAAKTAAVQASFDELQRKWDASKKAANTSHRQSVQQQAKPDGGIEFEKNDGLRMDKMLEELPA